MRQCGFFGTNQNCCGSYQQLPASPAQDQARDYRVFENKSQNLSSMVPSVSELKRIIQQDSDSGRKKAIGNSSMFL